MKKMMFAFLVFIALTKFAYPCSAIVLKKDSQVFLAKNFDWTFREGVIIKNARATNKTAYFTHNGNQTRWVSKYSSVTFNQNGKEMPYGGMNEKGLVVEMLWLDLSRYNINDEKQYVNELEWIQYQLDNYESVQQVVDHLNDLKIYPIKGKIHYIMTDPKGESVIVEYLNGKPVVYKKEANTCQAITNNPVLQSEFFKTQAKGLKKNNTSAYYRYYQLEQKISDLQKPSKMDE